MVEEPASEQLDIGGPVGTVRIQVFEMVTCAADWGGWHWFADGLDEDHARKHLRQRLESLDPFFGGPDYGAATPRPCTEGGRSRRVRWTCWPGTARSRCRCAGPPRSWSVAGR